MFLDTFIVDAHGLSPLSGVSSKEAELLPAFHDVQLARHLGLLHTFGQPLGHPCGEDLAGRSIFAWAERMDGAGRYPGPGDVRLEVVEESDVIPEEDGRQGLNLGLVTKYKQIKKSLF